MRVPLAYQRYQVPLRGHVTRTFSVKSSERGSALVEFGLIAIVLFMLIFGIIDFGRALFAYHYIANTAREATRMASVRGADCQLSFASCTMDLQSYFQTQAAGTGINTNKLTLVKSPLIMPGGPSICTTVVNNPGCTVQVSVNYQFQFIFPLLPALPLNMSSTSTTVITQ